LKYLHKNNWYHLHLHSGNIFIEEKSNTIKITELENTVCNLPIKNEQYFNFIYEDLNYNKEKEISNNNYNNNNNAKNLNKNEKNILFADIFKYNYNVFERIDIISFGRILYEMITGKELKSSFPDELELNDMDNDIAYILKCIFIRKEKNRNNNNNFKEIKIDNLLDMKFFSLENNEILQNEKNNNNNKDGIFYFFLSFLFISYLILFKFNNIIFFFVIFLDEISN
jgi:serine/threonine protein kinase